MHEFVIVIGLLMRFLRHFVVKVCMVHDLITSKAKYAWPYPKLFPIRGVSTFIKPLPKRYHIADPVLSKNLTSHTESELASLVFPESKKSAVVW